MFVPLGVPGATSGSMFAPVPVEVRTAHGPGQGFGSGLDPDSIRSVDPDPYSEDEGVRAPGCAGRHLWRHVHPCSRRGMTNKQFYLNADTNPDPGSQTNADPDLVKL